MKLTKAQRLFMKAGIAENKLRATAAAYRGREVQATPFLRVYVSRLMKELRARRKQLLREALAAWREEDLKSFQDGFNACDKGEIL